MLDRRAVRVLRVTGGGYSARAVVVYLRQRPGDKPGSFDVESHRLREPSEPHEMMIPPTRQRVNVYHS